MTATGQTTVSGYAFLAKNPESYTYDADGNLTSDGRWTNTWDGENRLINITSLAGTPTASQYKLALTYDYMGRRIQKIVSTNNGGAWVASYTNKFVYDGWNLVAILDSQSSILVSFTWGTDLSGFQSGAGLPRQSGATAGGVGGLISMKVCTGSNAGTYFPCYDGNGNVEAMGTRPPEPPPAPGNTTPLAASSARPARWPSSIRSSFPPSITTGRRAFITMATDITTPTQAAGLDGTRRGGRGWAEPLCICLERSPGRIDLLGIRDIRPLLLLNGIAGDSTWTVNWTLGTGEFKGYSYTNGYR